MRSGVMRRLNRKTRMSIRAAAHILVAATASVALAGNTWDGGGGDSNWETNVNWDADVSPGYGTLIFQGSTRTNNQFNNNWFMNQVNWNGAGAWTMNGPVASTSLQLFDFGGTQAKLESLGSGGVTINADVSF